MKISLLIILQFLFINSFAAQKEIRSNVSSESISINYQDDLLNVNFCESGQCEIIIEGMPLVTFQRKAKEVLRRTRNFELLREKVSAGIIGAGCGITLTALGMATKYGIQAEGFFLSTGIFAFILGPITLKTLLWDSGYLGKKIDASVNLTSDACELDQTIEVDNIQTYKNIILGMIE